MPWVKPMTGFKKDTTNSQLSKNQWPHLYIEFLRHEENSMKYRIGFGDIKIGSAVQTNDISIGIGGLSMTVTWTTADGTDWGSGNGGTTYDWQLLLTFGGSIGQQTYDTTDVLTFTTT